MLPRHMMVLILCLIAFVCAANAEDNPNEPLRARSLKVKVKADGTSPVTIKVLAGDVWVITAAGKWSWAKDKTCGPEGQGGYEYATAGQSAYKTRGDLEAHTTEESRQKRTEVGKGTTVTIKESGTMTLVMDDGDSDTSNNSGEVSVTLRLKKEGKQ